MELAFEIGKVSEIGGGVRAFDVKVDLPARYYPACVCVVEDCTRPGVWFLDFPGLQDRALGQDRAIEHARLSMQRSFCAA